jgi:hypothetical protein
MTIYTLNTIHFKRLNIRYSVTNLKRLGLITKQYYSASNGILVYDNVVKAKQKKKKYYKPLEISLVSIGELIK